MKELSATSPPGSRLRAAGLLGLACLLLLEVHLLGRAFKTDILAESPHVWAPWVRATQHQTPWGLSVLGVILALGGRSLWTRFEAARAQTPRPPSALGVLAVHCGAFAVFHVLTALLLGSAKIAAAPAFALFASWFLAGCSVLFSLGCIVLPARALARFLWEQRWLWVAGLVGGSAAFGVLRFLLTEWPYWEPLARATLHLAHAGVRLYETAPVFDPEALVLGTQAFPVHITRACTGYEGMTLFTVFFATFLVLRRHELRFPHALLLLPVGMLSAWMLNVVRIVVLVWIGDRISPKLAIDGFHAYAGWPLVILVALGAVVLARRIGYFARGGDLGAGGAALAHETHPGPTVNPAAVYLGPLIAILATILVGGALFAEDPRVYPLRIIAGCSVVFLYRREYRPHCARPCAAAFGFGVLAAVLWAAALAGSDATTSAGRPGSGDDGASGRVLLAIQWLGFVLIAPLTEELALRGYLARRLERPDFEAVDLRATGWIAFVVPAMVFGALHDDVLAGTVVGLVFSLATQWRGRLVDAVCAHATANFLLACTATLTEDWRYWS